MSKGDLIDLKGWIPIGQPPEDDFVKDRDYMIGYWYQGKWVAYIAKFTAMNLFICNGLLVAWPDYWREQLPPPPWHGHYP